MKRVKIILACIMLLSFATGISQTKKTPPPPPPPPPVMEVEKPVPPEKATMPELNLPPVPPTPPVPPPPPPPPPKKD